MRDSFLLNKREGGTQTLGADLPAAFLWEPERRSLQALDTLQVQSLAAEEAEIRFRPTRRVGRSYKATSEELLPIRRVHLSQAKVLAPEEENTEVDFVRMCSESFT